MASLALLPNSEEGVVSHCRDLVSKSPILSKDQRNSSIDEILTLLKSGAHELLFNPAILSASFRCIDTLLLGSDSINTKLQAKTSYKPIFDELEEVFQQVTMDPHADDSSSKILSDSQSSEIVETIDIFKSKGILNVILDIMHDFPMDVELQCAALELLATLFMPSAVDDSEQSINVLKTCLCAIFNHESENRVQSAAAVTIGRLTRVTLLYDSVTSVLSSPLHSLLFQSVETVLGISKPEKEENSGRKLTGIDLLLDALIRHDNKRLGNAVLRVIMNSVSTASAEEIDDLVLNVGLLHYLVQSLGSLVSSSMEGTSVDPGLFAAVQTLYRMCKSSEAHQLELMSIGAMEFLSWKSSLHRKELLRPVFLLLEMFIEHGSIPVDWSADESGSIDLASQEDSIKLVDVCETVVKAGILEAITASLALEPPLCPLVAETVFKILTRIVSSSMHNSPELQEKMSGLKIVDVLKKLTSYDGFEASLKHHCEEALHAVEHEVGLNLKSPQLADKQVAS